MQSMLRLEFY
uniref:Uncharacterized protein n=1 Tax=Anguilla anguilla TaxID=7936 RepID=A0A0E9QBN0_ANGAN